jgi:hypothetical protein
MSTSSCSTHKTFAVPCRPREKKKRKCLSRQRRREPRLVYTGLIGGQEHLKIETRSIDERFASVIITG